MSAVTGALTFPFTTVLPAGVYAFVLTTSYAVGFDSLLIRSKEIDTPDPYSGGIACIEVDDGGWQPVEVEGVNYHDILFAISGTAASDYVFVPPLAGPTKKRLIAVANNKIWYETTT